MPNPIKPRRSWTTGAVPAAGDFLSTNELLINWADGVIYGKNPSTNAVVSHTLGGSSDPRWSYLLPAAPTSVTATAGNGQVALSWTAPASVAPITDYVVQYSSNSDSTWTTFSDGTSTATSATVTGLTNGTAYTFRVAAVSGIGQGAWSSTTGGDAHYANVSLLLHGDGSLADSSPSSRSVTAYGDAAANGAAKYGSASLTFDGNGDWLKVPASSAFEFPGDFTIEFWVLFTGDALSFVGAYGAAIVLNYAYQAGQTNVGWQLRINGQTYTSINVFTGVSDLNFNGDPISQNVWHHVAVTRSGSTMRAFLDGSLYGSPITNSDALVPDAAKDLYIGSIATQDPNGYRFYLLGRLDELRLTKGVARYTSAFTPPSAAFDDYGPPTATPTA